jgi:activator of HSP90 ATPase
VQSWRTKHFTDGDPDSQIEVLLEPRGDQTLVRIVHTNVPDEDRGYEEGGWKDNYLDPMREYFATRN